MLIELLLEKKKINNLVFDKTKKEIKNSQKTEEQIILEKNLISEEELFELKSEILEIKLFDIDKFTPEALPIISFAIARDHKMIPIKKEDDCLHVGMVYPENQNDHEFLNFVLKKNKLISEIYLLSLSSFSILLKNYKKIEKEISKELEKIEKDTVLEDHTKDSLADLDQAPVVKIVNVILEQAVDGNASDIHIELTSSETRVRFRIMGRLYKGLSLPKNLSSPIINRVKILSKMKIDEGRRPQDGRFSMLIDKKKIDFRVSTFPVQGQEKIVLRILNLEDSKIIRIEDIGFLSNEIEIVKKETLKPYGLILVSGPTGSGKTTSLLALLSSINSVDINIVTMEDPVEYIIDGVNQSQVMADIGYTFASGLRSILRQDPDVIMVGEVRDSETASLLVNAALTGHLVFSTLHTNNVLGVIPRLIDMGVDPFLIAPVFNIAISQRLAKTLCVKCKKKHTLKKEEFKIIKNSINSLFDNELKSKYLQLLEKNNYIYKSVGCLKCNKIGYSGMTALTEILHINQELTALIIKNPTEKELKEEVKKQKMVNMQQNGMIKVLEGITTIEEVLRETNS